MMTSPVGRSLGSSARLQLDANDPRFQAAVNRAMGGGGKSKGQGRTLASYGYDKTGAVQIQQGGGVKLASGLSPVSAATRTLIDEAIRFDRDGNPNSAESAAKWNAVRDAIAEEIRQTLPADAVNPADPSGGMQITPALQQKVQGLNGWAAGTDRLAEKTREALELVDGEVVMKSRDKTLDDTIAAVEGNLNDVREQNDDHGWVRQGWDWATGGGAGDDFEDYLEGKLDELKLRTYAVSSVMGLRVLTRRGDLNRQCRASCRNSR
jgi:hypothetical protein